MYVSIQYQWRETEKDITIIVPLKGMLFKNMDLYVADLLVKISHRPFFLQIDLAREVIPVSLVTQIQNDVLLLTLEKVSKTLWNVLIYDGCKNSAVERRRKSMLRRSQEIRTLHENAMKTKVEEERSTLRDQVNNGR